MLLIARAREIALLQRSHSQPNKTLILSQKNKVLLNLREVYVGDFTNTGRVLHLTVYNSEKKDKVKSLEAIKSNLGDFYSFS